MQILIFALEIDSHDLIPVNTSNTDDQKETSFKSDSIQCINNFQNLTG